MHQQSLFTAQQSRIIPPRSIWKLRKKGIFLGTSGYSYEDWIGPFYQYGTKKPRMLEYYQNFFPATELNYTYYTMPRPSTLFQIRNKAPRMMFSVKAHRSITHERKPLKQNWRDFADSMMVLSDSDQLAALLFQFPYSFKCSSDNFAYLEEIIGYFDTFRIVLELRHASWYHKTTYDFARKRNITLCSVDAPKLPGLTNNAIIHSRKLAYYRLHGRNSANWFSGDNSTRYDYSYGATEIDDIINNILSLIETADYVYLYANNHPRAQAIETICKIADALAVHPSLATL